METLAVSDKPESDLPSLHSADQDLKSRRQRQTLPFLRQRGSESMGESRKVVISMFSAEFRQPITRCHFVDGLCPDKADKPGKASIAANQNRISASLASLERTGFPAENFNWLTVSAHDDAEARNIDGEKSHGEGGYADAPTRQSSRQAASYQGRLESRRPQSGPRCFARQAHVTRVHREKAWYGVATPMQREFKGVGSRNWGQWSARVWPMDDKELVYIAAKSQDSRLAITAPDVAARTQRRSPDQGCTSSVMSEDIARALERLVDKGWLREAKEEEIPQGEDHRPVFLLTDEGQATASAAEKHFGP
jgi:hypothetical protein